MYQGMRYWYCAKIFLQEDEPMLWIIHAERHPILMTHDSLAHYHRACCNTNYHLNSSMSHLLFYYTTFKFLLCYYSHQQLCNLKNHNSGFIFSIRISKISQNIFNIQDINIKLKSVLLPEIQYHIFICGLAYYYYQRFLIHVECTVMSLQQEVISADGN